MLESKSFVSSGNKVSLILLFAQNIHKLNLIVCSQSERKSESEREREFGIIGVIRSCNGILIM